MVTRAVMVVLAAVIAMSAGLLVQVRAEPVGDVKVVGPFVSGNLAVYLVRGADRPGDRHYLTLADGLEQGKVIMREKQEVNQLTVENRSDQDLFVQAGEIVKGGQQDRTLGRDMILPPHSGEVAIRANCVEQGRWSQRGQEDSLQFGSSANALSSKALREANYRGDQEEVWKSVGGVQAKLAAAAPGYQAAATTSPTSLELTVENKVIGSAAESYEKGLAKAGGGATDVIGFVFAINGKLNSGDVYGSSELFRKMYPKLLHAAAVEAVAERGGNQIERKIYDVPSTDVVLAMIKAVDSAKGESLAVQPADVEREINAQVRLSSELTPAPPDKGADRAIVVKKQTDAMTMFETRDAKSKAEFVHRAYLTR